MKENLTTSVLERNRSVNIRYQLVIFDFDGTLCHTEAADIHTIQKSYQRLHQPIPSIKAIQSALGQGVITQDIFGHLTPEAPPALIQKLLLGYKQIYPTQAKSTELFPGVVTLLDQLKARHIALVIISNKAIEILQSAIESLQIGEYFDAVMGVQADGLCKPDPKLYTHYIAPRFRTIQSHQILMVGDTSTDLRFAASINADACWASYGNGEPKSCQALRPAYTIQQVSDLLDIIFPSDSLYSSSHTD